MASTIGQFNQLPGVPPLKRSGRCVVLHTSCGRWAPDGEPTKTSPASTVNESAQDVSTNKNRCWQVQATVGALISSCNAETVWCWWVVPPTMLQLIAVNTQVAQRPKNQLSTVSRILTTHRTHTHTVKTYVYHRNFCLTKSGCQLSCLCWPTGHPRPGNAGVLLILGNKGSADQSPPTVNCLDLDKAKG